MKAQTESAPNAEQVLRSMLKASRDMFLFANLQPGIHKNNILDFCKALTAAAGAFASINGLDLMQTAASLMGDI